MSEPIRSDVAIAPLAASGSTRGYLAAKRVVDVALALFMLPVLLAALLLLGAWIRLDSPGPVLFRQWRTGRGGRPFAILKFRTMVALPDGSLAVTRAGRLLRPSRIDELPQLVNVLRGEMSFIGPRPETVAMAARYAVDLPGYARRHRVRPGITGWAQVNQQRVWTPDDVRTKLRHDLHYVANVSPGLDLRIMLRTAAMVAAALCRR